MEFVPELKHDNRLLLPRINDAVDEAFSLNGEAVSHALERDVEILKSYLARPGRGIGGSLLLRLSQLYEDAPYSEAALHCATATEIVNAHLLIIDDWIDNSDTRKGQPAIHKCYEEQGGSQTAGAQAVQLGMLALHVATMTLSKPELSAYHSVRNNIFQGAFRVSSANMLEPRLAVGDIEHTEESVHSLYEGKTGYYSFITPITSGLLLASAPNEQIAQFTEIGRLLGMAFQFQDDLMGIFGDPTVTGKPNIDDIREGLYTIVVHCASELLSDADFSELCSIHGSEVVAAEDIARYRQLLVDGEVKAVIEQEALKYLDAAEQLLIGVWDSSWNAETLHYMQSLIRFLRSKKY